MTARGKNVKGTNESAGEEEAPNNPTPKRPDEVPHTPNEIPNAPPREIPRDPMPTEQDRERAENEGMIAPLEEQQRPQGAKNRD